VTMTQGSLCVLLSLFCCSAVQGSVVDFSDSLHAGLKGSSLSMPTFAGLVQQHMGQTSKAPWKAQAEMFLGLLQSMGGQVPEDKANQTRHYVDEIIKLLTTSSDDIYADATTTKETMQTQVNTEYTDLETEEGSANKALANTKAVDSDLAKCYAHLKEIASNHGVHCGDKEPPHACVRKEKSKLHNFDVASKDKWICNFTAGSDPDKCTSDSSPLKTDLVSNRELLRLAYQTWKLENKTCTDDLNAERELCQNTNNTYVGKQATCQEMFINASDHLCNFRDKVDKWKTYLATLKTTQTRAKTLLQPKEKEYTDLNLIICMLEAFRDRKKMTFTDSDYSTCEEKAKNLKWVGKIDTLETKTETLTASSKYDHDCLEFSFSGGLAEKYMAPSDGSSPTVTFFTEPEVSFSYTEEGAGCVRASSAVSKKVCSAGFRVA